MGAVGTRWQVRDLRRDEGTGAAVSPGPLTGGCERHRYVEIAVIWPYEENLTLEYADDTLATYKVRHQPGGDLLDVYESKLFCTTRRTVHPSCTCGS